jgi:hypothetical protein
MWNPRIFDRVAFPYELTSRGIQPKNYVRLLSDDVLAAIQPEPALLALFPVALLRDVEGVPISVREPCDDYKLVGHFGFYNFAIADPWNASHRATLKEYLEDRHGIRDKKLIMLLFERGAREAIAKALSRLYPH